MNDDEQYETSTIAIASAVRTINLYSKVEYLLRPHIFRTHKEDILKTGLLGKVKVMINNILDT